MTSLLETARQLRLANLTVARLGREAWRETVRAQARLTSSETPRPTRSEPLLTVEMLRTIQERQRRFASPTELARAEALGDLREADSCEHCGGARFVGVKAREGEPAVAVPCWECVTLEERAQWAGVPRKFLNADVGALSGAARVLARDWTGARSLVLRGDVGTGKTYLACALLRRRLERGQAGRFVAVADLMDELKARFGDGAAEQSEAYFERLAGEPFLVLDDVGAEYESAWSAQRVAALIGRRYDAEAPTILTTNLTHRELAQRYGKRLADRLNEWVWAELTGPSLRRELAVQA